jgi:hypothetical protein
MLIKRQNREAQLVDYFRFLESNSQNQGTEEQAAELAREIDTKWWKENKHRFPPESSAL